MKLIKVPEDTDEIIDLKEFRDSIIEINKFNKNLEKFGNKILEKWIKPIYEWEKILSKEDCEKSNIFKIGKLIQNDLYIFDYKNKKLIPFIIYNHGWTMGASTSKETKISFSNCGNIIIIENIWETQEARFEHIPWIKRQEKFKIDYVNEIVLYK